MFTAEYFLSDIMEEYGEHSVSTKDEEKWYLQACRFLKIRHNLHSLMRKSLSREPFSTLNLLHN